MKTEMQLGVPRSRSELSKAKTWPGVGQSSSKQKKLTRRDSRSSVSQMSTNEPWRVCQACGKPLPVPTGPGQPPMSCLPVSGRSVSPCQELMRVFARANVLIHEIGIRRGNIGPGLGCMAGDFYYLANITRSYSSRRRIKGRYAKEKPPHRKSRRAKR